MILKKTNDIKEIKKGNIKIFEKIFRKLYAPLCGYAQKILYDKDLSEEVVQDVFYNLWKNKTKLEINVSLKSYLYKWVYNKCLQIIEHNKVKEKYRQFIINRIEHFTINPENELELNELNNTIKEGLNELPEQCRLIFQLSRNKGLKYHEIAKKLSISQKTVEANISKALKLLRKKLKVEN